MSLEQQLSIWVVAKQDVATIRNQELQYTNVYQEGGDYVTKDISKVLKTSKKIAEGLKLNYGEAYPQLASKETFQVEVIGEVEPVEVTEEYLAQIISARLKHIFEQIQTRFGKKTFVGLARWYCSDWWKCYSAGCR